MPHLHVFGFQRKRVNNLEQGHCFCALEWLQWIRFCRERGEGRSCSSNSKKAILAFQAITQLINPSARAISSSHSITFLVGLLSTIIFMLGAFKVHIANFASEMHISSMDPGTKWLGNWSFFQLDDLMRFAAKVVLWSRSCSNIGHILYEIVNRYM